MLARQAVARLLSGKLPGRPLRPGTTRDGTIESFFGRSFGRNLDPSR